MAATSARSSSPILTRSDSRLLRWILGIVAIGLVMWGCATVPDPAAVPPTVTLSMKITGYCPCGECCGWQRDMFLRPVYTSGPNRGRAKEVGVTASGTRAVPGTLAADTNRYPFGTIMYIEGYGYGRVEDTGSDIKGDHIDLFFESHAVADEWGVKRMRIPVWFQR